MSAARPEAEVQLCAFFIGAQEYALDLRRIEEIVKPLPITPLPVAPEFIQGVVTVKGVIIPVLNPRQRLHASGSPPSRKKPKLLVCKLGQRRVALAVDGVSEVIHTRVADLRPTPPLVTVGLLSYVIGAWGPPGQLKLLLNVKALLQTELPQ